MKITKELREYMKVHQLCEACGQPAYGLPHHIKHRAGGGGDESSNLLRLCPYCHYGIVHSTPGIKGLIERFPHLKEKVFKVRPALSAIIVKGI